MSHATSFFVGIALTITLVWTMTSWKADAAPNVGSGETTFTPVTPVRILDTRDGNDVGLAGPFASQVSQVLSVPGVPLGTSGVALNVTVVNPSAGGFISIEPGNASGIPATSSLNFDAGAVQPNAVTARLPTSGPGSRSIRITYDAYGVPGPTADIIIDLLGYYTNQGIQSLIADLATKVNANVVYTRSQIDAALAAKANAADVYTEAEVDALAASKANSADVYARFEVDSALGLKANYADVYHRDDVDLIASAKADQADLNAVAAAKADLADVYTRSQAEAAFIAQGDIVIYLGSNFSIDSNDSSDPNYKLAYSAAGAVVSGNGSVLMSLPARVGSAPPPSV